MNNTHRQARSPLVLIAEDEGDIADILSAYLGRSGLRSARAVDGESALALHRQLRPDLVLLDVQMPKLDGWQVLTELRRRGNTPVIMLTALDQDVDKLTGLRVGADDYVVKPFNPAEVIARVQAVLRRSAAAEIEIQVHQQMLSAKGLWILICLAMRSLYAIINRSGCQS